MQINNETITVKVWDTAGQERFKTIAHNFYRKSQGILLLFDVANKQTLSNINSWIMSITENANPDTKVYLIGNKIDLVNERQVPTDLGKKIAEKYNLKYFETSAKNNINVDEPFNSMVLEIMEKKRTSIGSEMDSKQLGKKNAEKVSKNCC